MRTNISRTLLSVLLAVTWAAPVLANSVSISDTLTIGSPTSKAPSPITPVFATITNFTAYSGPFPYKTGTFYVGSTGAYSGTLNSPAVSNGFYLLKGTFSPSTTTPGTPLSDFIVFSQQLTNTVISNIQLQAGQQYSYLWIFNSGNSAITFTLTGPGCISFFSNKCIVPSAAARAVSAFENVNINLDGVASRFDDLRATANDMTGASSGDDSLSRNLWVKLGRSYSDLDTSQSSSGFKGKQDGFTVGLDKELAAGWVVGAAVGHAEADIDYQGNAIGSTGGIITNQLLTYVSKTYGEYQLDGALAYAQHDFSTELAAATGSWKGEQWTAQVQAGKPFVRDALEITPFLGAAVSHLHQNGYTDSAGSQYKSDNFMSTKSIAGIKLTTEQQWSGLNLKPELKLTWRHEFGNRTIDSTLEGASADSGDKLDRDELAVKLGTRFWQNKTTEFNVALDYAKRAGYEKKSIDLTANWRF